MYHVYPINFPYWNDYEGSSTFESYGFILVIDNERRCITVNRTGREKERKGIPESLSLTKLHGFPGGYFQLINRQQNKRFKEHLKWERILYDFHENLD